MPSKSPTTSSSVWVPSAPTLGRPSPLRTAPPLVKRVYTPAERDHLFQAWWDAKEHADEIAAKLSAAHQAKIRAAEELCRAIGTRKKFNWKGHILSGGKRLSTYYIRQVNIENT